MRMAPVAKSLPNTQVSQSAFQNACVVEARARKCQQRKQRGAHGANTAISTNATHTPKHSPHYATHTHAR
eukprot:3597511-Alexandrium_andersonii.AAC.1